jgi:hypothetical protein
MLKTSPVTSDVTPLDESPVYRPRELAAMLGVKVGTLRKWRRAGIGPRFVQETSRSTVYLKASVVQWMRTIERQQVTHWRQKPKARASEPKRSVRAGA